MEEYYGKYFDLFDCVRSDLAGCPYKDLLIGVLKLLEDYNEFYQYELTLERHELLTTGERTARVKASDCGFHLVWGDANFNAAHRSGNLDSLTRFNFCYGDIDSYGNTNDYKISISNYMIEVNICIIDDKKGKFDVSSCNEFYENLKDYLINIIKSSDYYSFGYCAWGKKPSYIVKAEEEEKARQKAECESESADSTIEAPRSIFDC